MHKINKKVHQQEILFQKPGQLVKAKPNIINASPVRHYQGRDFNQGPHQLNSSNAQKNKKLKIKNQLNPKADDSKLVSRFSFQNEKMREKIVSPEIIKSGNREARIKFQNYQGNYQAEYNPYAEIQRNDMKYYAEYLQGTQKNSAGGLNLKSAYYFGVQ